MPTVRDVELMNQAFGNLAATIMQNRQLQERKRERTVAAQQAANNAAMLNQYRMATEKQREKGEQDTSDFRTAMLAQKQGAEQDKTKSNDMQNKIRLFHALTSLNTTGDLSDEGRKQLNEFLSQDPDFSSTGIQLQPPKNPKSAQKGSALQATVSAIQDYQQKAAAARTSGDEAQASEFERYAKLLEDNLPQAVKSTPSAKPTETKIETGISPTTGTAFGTTNTISYGTPPPMPGTNAPAGNDPLGIRKQQPVLNY